MAGYIRYANQGATRNRPLDDDLLKRLAYLQDMGITAEVFSGGQPGKDEGGARVGSVRHDHGHAGDMRFFQGDRQISWANENDRPIFEEIVRKGKQAGITGFGAGNGYMGEGTMHVGMGTPGVWGAGGKGDNAPGWLRDAYNGTTGTSDPASSAMLAEAVKNKTYDPIAEVLAAKGSATNTDTATAEKPKSHNGILVQAFNKITGKDLQVPGSILGAPTDKVMDAFSGLGDFAKASAEQDAELNRQIASASRGRTSVAPVELQLLATEVLGQKRKRRGGLGGLGGYTL